MTAILERRESESLLGRFCNWITSTENRLYIGWFGVLMIPTLLFRFFEFFFSFPFEKISRSSRSRVFQIDFGTFFLTQSRVFLGFRLAFLPIAVEEDTSSVNLI
jgi:hypothetical protein